MHDDDTGCDLDMNGLIIEVAVVTRDRPEIVLTAEGQAEAYARFEREALGRVRAQRTTGEASARG